MKKSAVIARISQIIGHSIRDSELYVTPSIFGTSRLKLRVENNGRRTDLNRVPSSYMFAHLSLVSAVAFCAVWAAVAEGSEPIVACVASVVAVSGIYGFTYWQNTSATEENPVLSFSSKSQQLLIPAQDRKIHEDQLVCLMSLASVVKNSRRNEKNYGELKLLYESLDGQESVILARQSKGWQKAFESECTPLAEALDIPFIHVERDLYKGGFSVFQFDKETA